MCSSLKRTSSPVSLFSLIFIPFGLCCCPMASHSSWHTQILMHVHWMNEGRKTCFLFFSSNSIYSPTKHFFIAILKAFAKWICALFIINIHIFKLNYLNQSALLQMSKPAGLGVGACGYNPSAITELAFWIQILAQSFGLSGIKFWLSHILAEWTWASHFTRLLHSLICKMRQIVPIS